MAACAECGTELPADATACPECGTPVPEVLPDDPEPWRPRLLTGDWRGPLSVAAPALVATFVIVTLAAASLLVLRTPGSDEPLLADTGAGRWLRYACSAVGLAFGSSVSVTQEYDTPDEFPLPEPTLYSVRFVPLAVTFFALLALWLLARRRGTVADRVGEAMRTAAVFAAGVAAVTAFGRWSAGDDSSPVFPMRYVFTTSPWKALFWAFLAAFAVGWLASAQGPVPERYREWAVAARGAAVGVATGVAASFLLLVSLAYLYADRAHAAAADVTSALPVATTYAPNLGTAAFGWASAGTLGRSGLAGRFSLGADDLGPGVYAAVLIPVVAVVVGVLVVRRRVDGPDVARVAALMAVPATALWLVLAAAGTLSVGTVAGFGVGGGSVAGPVRWNALLVALWFGPFAWLVARLVARRPFDRRTDAP